MRKTGVLVVLASLLIVQVGCGGQATKTGSAPATGVDSAVQFVVGSDTKTQQDEAHTDTGIDVEGKPDLVSQPCPGQPGCSCSTNTDCNNTLCIDAGDGTKVCGTLCVETCSVGQICAQITGPTGDLVSVCVARWPRLCDPCATNKDCESLGTVGSFCIDQGAVGHFCGTACVDDSGCPGAYKCAAASVPVQGTVKQCVPKGDDPAQLGFCACSSSAIQNNLKTSCYLEAKDATGTVVGKCAGVRSCAASGLSACLAAAPTQETCNGQDDDCNGQTDENSCNDQNPCTSDSCGGAAGCSHVGQTGKACDADGSPCTPGDTCVGATCLQGPSKNCDDQDPCTKDSCDLAGACTHVSDEGVGCDDDNPCTIGDTCQSGGCQPGKPKACKVDQPCTTAQCDLNTGKCTFLPADDGFPCDDGTACTAKDSCAGGKCKGAILSCDDSNPCTNDNCDGKTGCTHASSAAPCDDGDLCTFGDGCTAGACIGIAKADTACDDQDACTSDTCVPTTGCVHAFKDGIACDDGDVCTAADVCKSGKCVPGVQQCPCQQDVDCASKEDGDLCNGILTCKKGPAGTQCVVSPATIVACSQANDLTCAHNTCDPASGKCAMKAVEEGKPCDADGSVCTVSDACAGGKCVPGAGADCDDKNACTSDNCDAKAGCIHAANKATCDDGNACTVGDNCVASICLPGAVTKCDDGNACTDDACNSTTGCTVKVNSVVCDDGNACTTGDACASGKCVSTGKLACNDGNLCTTDTCDSKSGCTYSLVSNTCDDGNACTTSDSCSGGKCQGGAPPNCDDGNPCTIDSCAAVSGCEHIASSAPCNADDNACTAPDGCVDKVCVAGKGKVCDDNSVCTVDSCDVKTGGCVFDAAVLEGQLCDADGTVCTDKDACGGGKCLPGKVLGCDDANPCTNDACEPKTGCTHSANTSLCNADDNACTVGDKCEKTVCLPGSATKCDDANPCTLDGCDKVSGSCTFKSVPLDGTPCDADGSACTVGDACSGGNCLAGKGANCDDANPCTTDLCDKLTGCSHPSAGEGTPCGQAKACKSGACIDAGLCSASSKGIFEKTYSGYNYAGTAAVAPDGSTYVEFDTSSGYSLAKLGKQGEIVWTLAGMRSPATFSNGDIVAVTYVSGAATPYHVVRLTSDGKKVWEVALPILQNSGEAGSPIVTDSGDVYLFGHSNENTAPSCQQFFCVARDQMVVHVSSDGSTIDKFVYPFGGAGCYEELYRGAISQSGLLVAVGSMQSYSQDCKAIKLNGDRLAGASGGNFAWGKQLSKIVNCGGYGCTYLYYSVNDVVVRPDGVALALSSKYFDDIFFPDQSWPVAVVGLNASDGSPVFEWDYTANYGNKRISMVDNTGFATAGDGGGVILSRFRGDGQLFWTATYGKGTYQTIGDMKRFGTGGYVLTGTTSSGGVLVVRTDAWGNSNCTLSGKCADMKESDCEDGNDCTIDMCSALNNGCYHSLFPAGTACGSAGKCNNGVCVNP
jgi:hypothetical protein